MEWGMMLAGLVLLHGIAGFISSHAANAGTDFILKLLGIAAVRPPVEADAGAAPEADADIAAAGGASRGTGGMTTTASGGSGHAAPAAADGVSAGAGVMPLPGPHPAVSGSTAQAMPPVSDAQQPVPPGPASPGRDTPVPARRAALTFDDGPDGKYTPIVLDILSNYGVTATFFVVGIQAERYPEVLARIRDEGHEVGSHGYAHKNMGRMTAADIAEDLRLADEALREAAGIVPSLFRPPYGSVSDELKSALSEAGKTLVRWNVDPRDWDGAPADDIVSRVLEHAKDGAVILLHSFGGKNADLSGTIEALPEIIEGLLAQGYELTTVSGLELDSK